MCGREVRDLLSETFVIYGILIWYVEGSLDNILRIVIVTKPVPVGYLEGNHMRTWKYSTGNDRTWTHGDGERGLFALGQLF